MPFGKEYIEKEMKSQGKVITLPMPRTDLASWAADIAETTPMFTLPRIQSQAEL
jgi:hypothetical protein